MPSFFNTWNREITQAESDALIAEGRALLMANPKGLKWFKSIDEANEYLDWCHEHTPGSQTYYADNETCLKVFREPDHAFHYKMMWSEKMKARR